MRQHFSRWCERISGDSSLTRVDGCLRGIEAEKQNWAEAKECGFEFECGQEFKISETDDGIVTVTHRKTALSCCKGKM